MHSRDEEMEAAFPWIAWREPLIVHIEGLTFHVCRYCVAHRGLKARNLLNSPVESAEQIREHIEQEHRAPRA